MSKTPVSNGAVFLHQCLVHSDCKINWQTVADALGINSGAASKRMSRLKDRIKAQGVGSGNSWSGELDEDSTFLFQCIVSCDCKVDFNKVATVLPINSGAASKRFSRLKAKYAKSSAASNQPDTPATPQNLPSTSASRLPVPSNKRKADAPGSLSDGEVSQSAKKSRVATVKEEDETGDEEADAGKIPRNGAGMRKTRGKTLDFKALLAEDSDDSDNERPAIPATDGAGDCYEDTSGSETSIDDYSDGDWSNEDVSEDEKPKKRGVKKVSGLPTPTKTPSKPALRATRAQDDAAHKQETVINTGVETPPTTPPKNTAGAVRTVPPNTPVGLAGVQMLKTYRATNRAAPSALPRPVKSSSPIVPVKLTNSISSSYVNGETAPEELTDISDDDPVEKKSAASASAYSRESHKVTGDADQLQRQLSASLDADDDVEMWEDAVQDFEEDNVLQSIETDPTPATGFITRVFGWWK